jgi:HAD superfamily hydrolase (TIGR01509 family)
MKAILFDLDGVLVESVDVWLSAFNDALREMGFPPLSKEEFLKKHWGKSTVENFRSMGLGMDAVLLCWRRYLERLHEIKLFPATKEVLGRVRRRYKTALVTNTPKEGVERLLRRLGILDSFDLIVTGDDVREGKPSPEIVLLACRRLGITPAEALLVGDTQSDVEAGRRAGCRVVGIGVEADYTIKNIAELEPLLERVDPCT